MPRLNYDSSANETSHMTANLLWKISGVFLVMTHIISSPCVIFHEHQIDIHMVCVFMTIRFCLGRIIWVWVLLMGFQHAF